MRGELTKTTRAALVNFIERRRRDLEELEREVERRSDELRSARAYARQAKAEIADLEKDLDR